MTDRNESLIARETGAVELPDWLNAEVCIENAEIAYDDSLCDEDGPVDTVIGAGDLGVLIGLAKHALKSRPQPTPATRSGETPLDMCRHGADRGSYCGYCGGYSRGVEK